MFRHKLTLVLGFCAVATLSLMPISDLDLAVADTASVLTLPATGTPAAGAPTPQAAQEPVRVGKGTDHQEPRVVHRVEPSYPEEARAARLQGEVVIELIADAEGLVQEARVTQGVEGAPMLAEAAVEAIRQWRFEPLRIDDRPVPMIVTISVRFRLED